MNIDYDNFSQDNSFSRRVQLHLYTKSSSFIQRFSTFFIKGADKAFIVLNNKKEFLFKEKYQLSTAEKIIYEKKECFTQIDL